ncbi:hypothetical protein C8J57DRAFT_400027 [Mycena rebaudengoi]|nr:hypothetical protein C8J57DRAFT_400027 [Mycena rebaudengoi]
MPLPVTDVVVPPSPIHRTPKLPLTAWIARRPRISSRPIGPSVRSLPYSRSVLTLPAPVQRPFTPAQSGLCRLMASSLSYPALIPSREPFVASSAEPNRRRHYTLALSRPFNTFFRRAVSAFLCAGGSFIVACHRPRADMQLGVDLRDNLSARQLHRATHLLPFGRVVGGAGYFSAYPCLLPSSLPRSRPSSCRRAARGGRPPHSRHHHAPRPPRLAALAVARPILSPPSALSCFSAASAHS